MERKALGRGINALIPEKSPEANQERILYVSLETLRPNPFQPREDFDSQSLEELKQSIQEKGVIQPILVRRKGDYYEIIAGERRYRACKLLGISEIPIIVKEVDDKEALELALIENIQRQDLNPIEQARAYQYLIEKYQVSQEKIAQVLGKARVTITNILRLLKLPQEIQEELKKGRISYTHGRALLELDDPNQQRKLCQEIIAKGLSMRELENLIKAQRKDSDWSKRRKEKAVDPYLVLLEEKLQQALATKVKIVRQRKQGHIVVEFYSQEDLERIVKRIEGGSVA